MNFYIKEIYKSYFYITYLSKYSNRVRYASSVFTRINGEISYMRENTMEEYYKRTYKYQIILKGNEEFLKKL